MCYNRNRLYVCTICACAVCKSAEEENDGSSSSLEKMEEVRDTLAGGLGGLACALAGQPLDTVKVKLQTYPQVYSSSLQALARTYFEEGGLRAVYAGCGAAMASNVAENAVLFVCYERCLDLVRWATGEQGSGREMSVGKQATAGALASVASSVAITPLERIKCKMQVQGQQRTGSGRWLSAVCALSPSLTTAASGVWWEPSCRRRESEASSEA